MGTRDFLEKILGPSYKALESLLKTDLEGVVVARAALAWLKNAPEGDLFCGCPMLYKSEDGISGLVECNGGNYLFVDSTPEHATAALVSSLGLSLDKSFTKDLDLAKLGHSLDLLVKAQSKAPDEPLLGQTAKPWPLWLQFNPRRRLRKSKPLDVLVVCLRPPPYPKKTLGL